ncbi:MarC family protein [Amphritea sp. 2_MG-2023]|jgi:multiple antibiotic resistance protein|uniref:MarC family protein n=1 Tax=Amphritea TaxID=515417 RepID=UPI001C078F15|nr:MULTISPECIES: MarC family protein [Amphritea]MBU2963848.1 MarC family protein [Amphritea atlantica]MDO6419013.1 MarC family protein [Amphritea sp. 2_MG-2023]MDX2424469.1 MarC family protein [Amphritea sp.]
MTLLITTWIKFFVLFAPFFVVSMFLSLTRGDTAAERRSTANKAVFAATLAALVLFFFGSPLFELLGITIDSFRIGAGILLFLSAISLVREGVRTNAQVPDTIREDTSVVPLAIPTIIGPATIGAILVYGSELHGVEMILGITGMFLALISLLLLLHIATRLERLLGKTGLNILSKITGLILAAMASEIVLTGITGFMTRIGH